MPPLWWPTGMDHLELPQLLSHLSSCMHPYMFYLISVPMVLFLLLSNQFSVCALNLSLLFLVLAPLVILLLACLSSSSSFSSCWTLIDLQVVAQMSPAGSLWLPGLREVPLFCILSGSPAPLEHSSHKGIWGLFACFPHLQGKLPEAHDCMVFCLV